MNFAVYGNMFNVGKIFQNFKDVKVLYELKHDATSTRGGVEYSLPTINFFEFRRLIDLNKLDGLFINMDSRYAQKFIKECKLYSIPKVFFIHPNPFNPIYGLNPHKGFMRYIETNLIDSCNLNCSGCTHYANLFDDGDFYSPESFERDMKILSNFVDVLKFRLLGGEPFKLPNLIDYVKIARKYFPQTSFHLVTNALLIPTASQDLLDVIRENNFIIDITTYPPTEKVIDKVKAILTENKIFFTYGGKVTNFVVFLTLHGVHDPQKSRAVCINDGCRFLRDGKIYKCPVDALSYKLAEKFGLIGFPKSTGVNIGAPNFVSLLEELDGNVECCHWCNETARAIQWKTSNKPTLDEWLANPMEALNLCSFKNEM